MQWLIDIIGTGGGGPPTGSIILWSGTKLDIPDGYVLCDGNNGTPDLRNVFVIGAGSTYVAGATGGDSNHVHTFNTDGHAHGITSGVYLGGSGKCASLTDVQSDYGSTNNGSFLPPYHALCYIMKT